MVSAFFLSHALLPLMLLGTSVAPADEALGCRITVKASNASRTDIWLMSEDSRVRAEVKTPLGPKWGPWKVIPMSNRRIRPGESASMTAELDLGCSNRRQYQFRFKQGSNTADKNYGSTGTTRTTIDLGNAAVLF